MDTKCPLYGVHCRLHCLHLAIHHAMNNVPYYNLFEDSINQVHNFYNWHGNKRKAHLRELAFILNINMYELSYIYKERWIFSEFSALSKLNSTWLLVVTYLDGISVDPIFNIATQNKAKRISKRLTNKYFFIILSLHVTYWKCCLIQQRAEYYLLGMDEK